MEEEDVRRKESQEEKENVRRNERLSGGKRLCQEKLEVDVRHGVGSRVSCEIRGGQEEGM